MFETLTFVYSLTVGTDGSSVESAGVGFVEMVNQPVVSHDNNWFNIVHTVLHYRVEQARRKRMVSVTNNCIKYEKQMFNTFYTALNLIYRISFVRTRW